MGHVAADQELVERIDRYLDAAPRAGATVEDRGALSIFVAHAGGFPFYARPTLGWSGPEPTVDDVRAVRQRQVDLDQPEAVEWIVERAPALADACRATGLHVSLHPLLVLDGPVVHPAPTDGPAPDIQVLPADANDQDLASALALAGVAFAHPGTAVGPVGDLPSDLDLRRLPALRARIAAGSMVAVLATIDGRPVATASAVPVDNTAEVVGVGTLPAFRRRGIGAQVTVAAVQAAQDHGAMLVFLAADDYDVAQLYERLGFRRIATAVVAAVPAGR